MTLFRRSAIPSSVLVLLLSVVVAGAFFAFVAWSGLRARRVMQDHLDEQLRMESRLIHEGVTGVTDRYRAEAGLIATYSLGEYVDGRRERGSISTLFEMELSRNFLALTYGYYATDRDRSVIRSDAGTEGAAAEAWAAALADDMAHLKGFRWDKFFSVRVRHYMQRTEIAFLFPEFSMGVFTGVFVSVVDLTPVMKRFMSPIAVTSGRDAYLFDGSGRLLFSGSNGNASFLEPGVQGAPLSDEVFSLLFHNGSRLPAGTRVMEVPLDNRSGLGRQVLFTWDTIPVGPVHFLSVVRFDLNRESKLLTEVQTEHIAATVLVMFVFLSAAIAFGYRDRLETQRDMAAEMTDRLEHEVAERTRELSEAKAHMQGVLEERGVLLREIHHRVKNNLQLVSSIINLQFCSTDGVPLEVAVSNIQMRVYAMSVVHEQLYRSDNLARVNMKDYLGVLASHIQTFFEPMVERVTLTLEVDELWYEADRAIPVGLIVNELVTNSYKHAFPNGRTGRITVRLAARGPDEIELSVSDTGPGTPSGGRGKEEPGRSSLGLTIVESLAQQLGGELVHGRATSSGKAGGTSFTLTFRASRLET